MYTYKHLPSKERKKILLLGDDIRSNTGVGTMSREFVLGTAQHFNWFTVGGFLNTPDAGKLYDLSEEVNKTTGLEDSQVKVLSYNGYGDANLIRTLLKQEKPDAIFIFTDPRYWVWLFEIEREVRQRIPICWLNIWDDLPYPLYNKDYYNSVDALFAISKQTQLINRVVLGDQIKTKVSKYIPHGINEKDFYPLDKTSEQYKDFKNTLFGDKEIEFTVFFNSRNIHRKHPADLILAYRMFCDRIGIEAAKKCALILHTQSVDNNGTDLNAVRELLCDPEIHNVFFSEKPILPSQMNMLYNIADVTVLPTSNEGWGLSITESLMAGTMIIANVTGGMQDQMRFEDENGLWYTPNQKVPSNHRGTYKNHGPWVKPVFPTNLSLTGAPPTPYIFDDRCSPEDLAEAIEIVYRIPDQTRVEKGLKGREWVLSEESMMSSVNMCKNIIDGVDETLEKFIPRPKFDIIKVEDRPRKYLQDSVYGY